MPYGRSFAVLKFILADLLLVPAICFEKVMVRLDQISDRPFLGQNGLGPEVRLRLQCAGHLPYNRRPCRAAILILDERSRAQSNARR